MFEEMLLQREIEEEADFMPFISIEEDEEPGKNDVVAEELPILALKNTVLFPNNVIPITVGRDKSIKAINKAYETNRQIAVISQRDVKLEDPTEKDLYRIGTVAHILKVLKMKLL